MGGACGGTWRYVRANGTTRVEGEEQRVSYFKHADNEQGENYMTMLQIERSTSVMIWPLNSLSKSS